MDNQPAVALLKGYKSPEKLSNVQKTVLNWIMDL